MIIPVDFSLYNSQLFNVDTLVQALHIIALPALIFILVGVIMLASHKQFILPSASIGVVGGFMCNYLHEEISISLAGTGLSVFSLVSGMILYFANKKEHVSHPAPTSSTAPQFQTKNRLPDPSKHYINFHDASYEYTIMDNYLVAGEVVIDLNLASVIPLKNGEAYRIKTSEIGEIAFWAYSEDHLKMQKTGSVPVQQEAASKFIQTQIHFNEIDTSEVQFEQQEDIAERTEDGRQLPKDVVGNRNQVQNSQTAILKPRSKSV